MASSENEILLSELRNFSDLPNLFFFDSAPSGTALDGVAVTTFGRGQLTGATWTVPAHGEMEFDIELRMSFVTPEAVKTLSAFIKGLLDVSRYSKFEELEKTEVSGGLGLFAFFSFGASASYSDTKHRMEGWGLSEDNQKKIVSEMMKLISEPSVLRAKGKIYNKDSEYSVSGSLFGIIMDATVQQGEQHKQLRFLAPKPQFVGTGGSPTIPTVDPLYT